MIRLLLTLVAVGALFAPFARAQDSDPIKVALDKAKADYDSVTEKLRSDLLKALQDKEDAARSTGNKKVVDQDKAEREAYEARGELPRSVPTANYVKESRTARAKLEAAYTTAVKEYTKAKKDDEATAAEKDLAAFKLEAGTPAASLTQQLTKGSVWDGVRRNATDRGKVSDQPCHIKVSQVDGKNFKGTIVINSTFKADFEGVMDGAKVVIRTEKKGKFQHLYEGRLRGNTLELAYAGTGGSGEQVKGVALLTLKK